MTQKKTTEEGKIQNNTATELEILQKIEKAFYRNNKDSQKRNTAKSMRWFSRYVPRSYNKVANSVMYRDRSLWTKRIVPGRMYFFEYDALHKDTLPIWDRYPLIFPWDSWKGNNGVTYFIGINLHYLPPALRYQAIRALITLRNEKRYRKSTKLRISWGVLSALSKKKLFEHSVHMYRMDRVRSTFVEIPPQSWELALWLPTARWQKGSAKQAYRMK